MNKFRLNDSCEILPGNIMMSNNEANQSPNAAFG